MAPTMVTSMPSRIQVIPSANRMQMKAAPWQAIEAGRNVGGQLPGFARCFADQLSMPVLQGLSGDRHFFPNDAVQNQDEHLLKEPRWAAPEYQQEASLMAGVDNGRLDIRHQ